MQKLSQKWAIILIFDKYQEGTIFNYDEFPLHVTIAGVFEIDYDGDWLASELNKVIGAKKQFEITADKIAMFGPKQDIAVMKIIKSPELMELYNNVYNFLIASGAVYNEPEYQGGGYIPHSTFQKSGNLKKGQTVTIKSVSIIDLFPNNDGYKRKIHKTIDLNHKN